MKIDREDVVRQLEGWFDANGKVIDTSTGKWARGYLDKIADMLITEIDKAYKKGLEDGPKREDQGNTKTVRRQPRKQDRVR